MVRELPCSCPTGGALASIRSLSEPVPGITMAHDDELEEQLRAMLAVRRLPSLGRITLRVDAAVVYLGGTVSTYFERNTCEECCRRIEGVLGIHNQIHVEVTESNQNAAGAAAVR